MTESELASAREGDELAFTRLTEPYRGELQLHCYRILGSFQDAEDATQETLLSAWRALDGFQERASLRSWLYRIATNRCLNMLRESSRRPAGQLTFVPPEPTRYAEPLWLEPYPDALLDRLPDTAPGPHVRYETREAVSLAFVTALQRLPARQRAVLVLRDVLGYSAAEAGEMLETTEASVNSALVRARATVDDRGPGSHERAPLPRSAQEQALVGSFADAFERGDVEEIVVLLTADAWVTMPPEPHEYQGHDAIRAFLEHAFDTRQGRRDRLVPTRANAQPAFGHYIGDPYAPVVRAVGILVLTMREDRISRITRFGGSASLPAFGLPRTLPW